MPGSLELTIVAAVVEDNIAVSTPTLVRRWSGKRFSSSLLIDCGWSFFSKISNFVDGFLRLFGFFSSWTGETCGLRLLGALWN